MAILAFETSCDETSAAVVSEGRVLASVVSSQISLHAEYGGVVPELAAAVERVPDGVVVPIVRGRFQDVDQPLDRISSRIAVTPSR